MTNRGTRQLRAAGRRAHTRRRRVEKDIVKRLRLLALQPGMDGSSNAMLVEAADEIERLRVGEEVLRGALEAMHEEFRGHDLPYGSKAYAQASEALNFKGHEAPYNKLTPAEAERLAMLAEECGEVVQAVCKILRHGYESYHPADPSTTNRQLLERELLDLTVVEGMLHMRRDIDLLAGDSRESVERKLRYARHQGDRE